MKQSYFAGMAIASVLALGVYASAQAPGQPPAGGGAPGAGQGQPGQMPGRGRQGGMPGAGRGQQDPNSPFGKSLHITGENPGLQLRLADNGPIVTEVNYWNVAWSPVGSGHVCYVMTGDGKGKDDLRLALTDSDALEKFVTYDTMSKLVPNFGTPAYKVIKATFSTEGDTINERSEICKSPQYTVKATWRKMNPGNWGSMNPRNGFFMMFNIQMASEGEITINGKRQPGTVRPGPGRPPAYLAFAETWVKMPTEQPQQ